MASKAPGKPGPSGSPKLHSLGRLNKNLCPENRMRYRRVFLPEKPETVQSVAVFFVVTSLLAAAVNGLGSTGLAYTWGLRIIALTLVALGILELPLGTKGWLIDGLQKIRAIWHEQNFWGKLAISLVGLTTLGLCLSALGPPTDADSLDYHLGVPLDILRHHGAYPRPDWFHARLAGLGESLNMLGLAGGTDIFGATLQFAALVGILMSIVSIAKNNRDKIFLAMGVLACPVLVFLVPNQKPQMLPAGAITIAMILIALRFRSMDCTTLLLAFCCVFFAMACKYSFILSGIIVLAIGILAAYNNKIIIKAMGIAILGYLVFVFPLHLQNYLFYGDPISPFLERFRPGGDTALIIFANKLRAYSDSASNAFPFPINLMLPSSFGELSTILGIGPICIFLIVNNFKSFLYSKDYIVNRTLMIAICLTSIVILTLGQVGARFLLEPYFWIISMAAFSHWEAIKNILFYVMISQTLAMTIIVLFGALILFPGSLTASLRDKVMTVCANNYAPMRWIDSALPKDAILISDKLRSAALYPRPFVSRTIFFYDLSDPVALAKVRSILLAANVNTLITAIPISEKVAPLFDPILGQAIGGPKAFSDASRNPWKREDNFKLMVYKLNLDKERGTQ
jgi:hypothetical protein